VVTDNFEAARKEAKAAEKAVLEGEELGLLHGLPVGVKDLEITKGLAHYFWLQTLSQIIFRHMINPLWRLFAVKARLSSAKQTPLNLGLAGIHAIFFLARRATRLISARPLAAHLAGQRSGLQQV
jgi:hypothetical protein